MGRAARLFYLALFSFLGDGRASTPARARPGDVCAFEPDAIVSDACVSYSTLEAINADLRPYIHLLTHNTDFFSYYRLNLYNKTCPFWSEEEGGGGMCGNIACAVSTVEREEEVPAVWRAAELGKLEGRKAAHPDRLQQRAQQERPLRGELGEGVRESCVVEYDDECDDRDYCVPEDEGAQAKGEYVSLVDNPERYTGYAGASARHVWEAIYRENCFGGGGVAGGAGQSRNLQAQAAHDLGSVIRGHGVQQALLAGDADERGISGLEEVMFLEDDCLERRVFYRIISGMHASISMHICWDHLNKTSGQWGPDLACYEQRLHRHPDRLANLYFNYALVLRAVGKLQNQLRDYVFCNADTAQDQRTHRLVLTLATAISRISPGSTIFDESAMFVTPGDSNSLSPSSSSFSSSSSSPSSSAAAAAPVLLKDDFRARFRNVSRVMDCVGCDKCRLWGKLQTAGYGAALKALFEFDGPAAPPPPLRRTELVALVNTLDRLAHSIYVAREFRRMLALRDGDDAAAVAADIAADDAAAAASFKSILDSTLASHSRSPPHAPPHSPSPYEGAAGHDAGSALSGSDGGVEKGQEDEGKEEEGDELGAIDEIVQAFKEEWNTVWSTYMYVLKSWARVPVKVYHILIVEMARLWDFWVGLPVEPRSWYLRFPERDEL